MWNALRTALIGGFLLLIAEGLGMLFPDTTPALAIWTAAAFIAFIAFPLTYERPRKWATAVVLAVVISVRDSGLTPWVMVGVILLLGVVAVPRVMEFHAETQDTIAAHVAPFWTRPIYRADNELDRLIVLECERSAIKKGRLHNLMRNDERGATEHFRWCLGDQGLDWEICASGEDGCGLLRFVPLPLGPVPSVFIEDR